MVMKAHEEHIKFLKEKGFSDTEIDELAKRIEFTANEVLQVFKKSDLPLGAIFGILQALTQIITHRIDMELKNNGL